MEYCVIDKMDIADLVYEYLCSDGYIAVVKSDKTLVGLFGYKEYLNFINCVTSCDKDIERVALTSWINCNPIVSNISNGKNNAFEIMKEHNITYIPVVDKNRLFVRFETTSIDKRISYRELTMRNIAQKWKFFDRYVNVHEYRIKCPICNSLISDDKAEKKVSYDIAGGGRLVRYICETCGAIVGPKKMFMLEEEDFNLDYEQHYNVYSEGDTTEDEIYTFSLLEGDKNGRYLNYGCGGEWSKSIEILRKKGYEIYGYEPFAGERKKDYIISDKNMLSKMKFDGLFTNNLIEHLKDPIGELNYMKGLLNGKNCKMVHSTGCFEYQYPYTRFHVCFPIGDSTKMMFEKAGLVVNRRVEKKIHDDKMISYVVMGGGVNGE